jgi:hypothetical protein
MFLNNVPDLDPVALADLPLHGASISYSINSPVPESTGRIAMGHNLRYTRTLRPDLTPDLTPGLPAALTIVGVHAQPT